MRGPKKIKIKAVSASLYGSAPGAGLYSRQGVSTYKSATVKLESLTPIQGIEEDWLLTLLNVGMSPEALRLREWVDEWLGSGRSAQGDSPASRNAAGAPGAGGAVYSYSQKYPVSLLLTGSGLEPWWNLIDPSQTTAWTLAQPKHTKPLPLGSRYAPDISAEDKAAEVLTLFLLSDLRFSLAKCAECGTYFVLSLQRQNVYKRGTLCLSCKGLGRQQSIVSATLKARRLAAQKLFDAVASSFGRKITKSTDWTKERLLRAKIVEKLNALVERDRSLQTIYPTPLTDRWLAREKNQQGITEAISKLNAPSRRGG